MFHAVQLDAHANSVLWRSSLLDDIAVIHGFTTQHWNVKTSEEVADLIRIAGWFRDQPPPRVVLSKQVHANAVDTPGGRLAEADAHVTDDPREVVAVRTADCVPVLLSSADGQAVAAVHAGWRGLAPAVNVIGEAVAALQKLVGRNAAEEFVAAVGPCISAARYEVGEEVASRFRDATPHAVLDDLGAKPHLDTRAVAVAQLVAAGVSAERIDVFPGCTFDEAGAFFSFRREGQGVGHLAAIITPRASG